MQLTIGSKTIEITSCDKLRDNRKGFFLEIIAPKSSIGMDDFYALLKDNKETITVTGDGVEKIYKGFGLLGHFSCENDTYHIAQYANSEIEAQLSLVQNKNAEQAATIVQLQEIINEQEQALESHANVITAQAKALEDHANVINTQAQMITAQQEQVAVLTDMSAAQLSTIDSILSEVVPNIIDLAIMQAIEAVTASGSGEVGAGEIVEDTTETEEPVDEPVEENPEPTEQEASEGEVETDEESDTAEVTTGEDSDVINDVEE